MYEVIGSLDLGNRHILVFLSMPCDVGVIVDEELESEFVGQIHLTEIGMYLVYNNQLQIIEVPFTNVCKIDTYPDGVYIETISHDYSRYMDYDVRLLDQKDSPEQLSTILIELMSTEQLYPVRHHSKMFLSTARDTTEEEDDPIVTMPEFDLLNGYEFEDFISGVFQGLGYIVEQTPRSRDQGVDLILTKGDIRAALQTKRYKEPVGNGAVQEVFTGRYHYGCTHAAVITTSTYSPSARELAQSTGVQLWDRTHLEFFYKLSSLDLQVDFPVF